MAAPALLAPSVATSAAAAASAVWLSLRAFGYTDAIVATRSAALGAQAAGRSAGSGRLARGPVKPALRCENFGFLGDKILVCDEILVF